jgi:hypothetical protein
MKGLKNKVWTNANFLSLSTCQINRSMEEPNDAAVQRTSQPNLVVSAAAAASAVR